MIRHDVVQGTPEWLMLRVGIPTASKFDKIITPKTMKPSGSADAYLHQLLAEQILGVPLDNASSGFMQRGSVLEHRAVQYYELLQECETEAIGFLTLDDGRAGASPDRFVGPEGLLEIKVPSAANHIGYLLDDQGIGYRCQVQGQLWISEREWCDTLSWNPDFPPALIRQRRDEKFIDALELAVEQFLNALDEAKVKLQKFGLFEGFQQPMLKVVA